ncbi:hypothetical protein C8R44DRAFT_892310 [Mycena epipterygia]|nr:hypothetical protein C8R44DRAFT_892310 [Mycena epipterygia]
MVTNFPDVGSPVLIDITDTLWADPTYSDRAMSLLRSALDRGGDCSLAVFAANDSGAPSLGPALQLVAKHSARWNSLMFHGSFSNLRHLSASAGKLPRLVRLGIHGWGADDMVVSEIFRVVLRLKTFEFAGDNGSTGALMALVCSLPRGR